MTKTRYVVGFCFTTDKYEVVLIQKNRPKWQAGRYNGVGGKIEPGESIHQAMSREFFEEAGVAIPPIEWDYFAVLNGPNWQVHVFRAFNKAALTAKTQETEKIRIVPSYQLPGCVLTNLNWLIPLALDVGRDGAPTGVVSVNYGEKHPDTATPRNMVD